MPAPTRRSAPPRAIPLIVTVFGDAVLPFGGRVWLGSLIRLLEPLGVSERLVRTSVYRLAREHWLRADALGRRSDYLLTDFGRRRFDEIAANLGIARNVLTQRLQRLIEEDVLTKVAYQERPQRFEYRLTDKGRRLAAGGGP